MKTFLSKLKVFFLTILQRLLTTMLMYLECGLANHAAACAYGFLLSMAPILLLLAFLIFLIFMPSPEAIIAFMSTIPVLENLFDEQWLYSEFFTFTKHGLANVIFILSIIWAGRILALSMQRGLKIIFVAEKDRNPVKDTLVTLIIEASVIVLVLVVLVSSRVAVTLFHYFLFIPDIPLLKYIITHTGGQISALFLLGLAAFLLYMFVPVNSPRKVSALQGSVICVLFYSLIAFLFRIIINRARYNFLYGTLGNLIIILVNVYFFFMFFFIGAMWAYIRDNQKTVPSAFSDILPNINKWRSSSKKGTE